MPLNKSIEINKNTEEKSKNQYALPFTNEYICVGVCVLHPAGEFAQFMKCAIFCPFYKMAKCVA